MWRAMRPGESHRSRGRERDQYPKWAYSKPHEMAMVEIASYTPLSAAPGCAVQRHWSVHMTICTSAPVAYISWCTLTSYAKRDKYRASRMQEVCECPFGCREVAKGIKLHPYVFSLINRIYSPPLLICSKAVVFTLNDDYHTLSRKKTVRTGGESLCNRYKKGCIFCHRELWCFS